MGEGYSSIEAAIDLFRISLANNNLDLLIKASQYDNI